MREREREKKRGEMTRRGASSFLSANPFFSAFHFICNDSVFFFWRLIQHSVSSVIILIDTHERVVSHVWISHVRVTWGRDSQTATHTATHNVEVCMDIPTNNFFIYITIDTHE